MAAAGANKAPVQSDAWADVGGVPPRELAGACIDAIESGCGLAPAEWISANVPEPLRAWVADYVAVHVEMQTLAMGARSGEHRPARGGRLRGSWS